MRVLALTPNPPGKAPGQRYRIEQWQPYLERKGVEIEYAPFMSPSLESVVYAPGRFFEKAAGVLKAYLKQIARVRHPREFDVIYLFREAALVGPALIESWAARAGARIVFDFDDAIFVTYRSPVNAYWSYLKFPGKTATLCRLARHVMAGNRYLADYARRHNSKVSIVPTSIDTSVYRPELRNRRGQRPICIGWTGSHSTAQHLDEITQALAKLAKRHSFRLVVVGTEPPTIPGVSIESRPWRAATEAEDLSDVDIGIMPLPDDEWTRGKCGCKALQFMALGIPAVVSPVGVNTEIVRHGHNGLLAESDQDWIAQLSKLIENRQLRERLGREAQITVEKKYSAQVVAPAVFDIFQRAAAPTDR